MHHGFRTPILGAALIALPTLMPAQTFDGVYEYSFCDNPPFVALTIDGAEASYYDTPCTLADAVPQDDPEGAVQYTMSCDHGSGPQPQEVMFYFNSDGDLVMRTGDLEDRFVSCQGG